MFSALRFQSISTLCTVGPGCNAPDSVLGFVPGFMCGLYMKDCDPGSMGVYYVAKWLQVSWNRVLIVFYYVCILYFNCAKRSVERVRA